MSVQDAISKAEGEFSKAITHLKDEFSRLQVGRANTALVEGVMVDMYGQSQPMKALASITTPDAKTIQIQPWDKSALAPIEKGIVVADLGLNPVNDGTCVRISIPDLTEERRRELVKHVKKMAEDARIVVRNLRQDAHNHFKKLKADNEITEDDLRSADKKLQDKVDDANKSIDEVAKKKEEDVMTI